MAERTVTLRNGRIAGVQGSGDPVSRRIVVFCHPAPGSCAFDPDPAITDAWDVHLLGLERPGYGASPPLPDETWPSIADRADDIAGYLRSILGEARMTGDPESRHIGVVGWSAGGRIALALAARHPDLIDRVAVVATPAPNSAVEWIPSPDAAANAQLLTRPAADAKRALRERLAPQIPASGAATPVSAGASDADVPTLEGLGVRNRVERMLEQAYTQGAAGLADDILSYTSDDWGFDLGDVRAKTLLIYGGRDPIVSSAHGRWYRHRIKGAHLTVVPRSGHLVVIDAWREILDHVAPADAGATPKHG